MVKTQWWTVRSERHRWEPFASVNAVTDASVNCELKDRNATTVRTSVLKQNISHCCRPLWGQICTPHASTTVVDTRTENKCSGQERRHHKSGDVEEEYTFIVDLSSRTQRAWRRCRRGERVSQGGGIEGGEGSRSGLHWDPKRESAALAYTHCTWRKKRAAGVVPACALLRKESSALCYGLNATFRSHRDRRWGWCQDRVFFRQRGRLGVWLCVLCGFNRNCIGLSKRGAELSYVRPAPESRLKCNRCRSGHVSVSIHNRCNKAQCGRNYLWPLGGDTVNTISRQ